MRFLVTAGPTREPIDDVRHLSNRSTGAMGFAIAAAALAQGHEVVLVAGPVSIAPPAGAATVSVETALQMRDAVMSRLDACDALVMCAAVADFRPRDRIAGKRKKTGDESETWTIELVRNPDILAEAGRTKGRRVHAGFALESEDLVFNAQRKMIEKNLDFIVANSPSAIGAARSEALLIFADGRIENLGTRLKAETAGRIVSECAALFSRLTS